MRVLEASCIAAEEGVKAGLTKTSETGGSDDQQQRRLGMLLLDGCERDVPAVREREQRRVGDPLTGRLRSMGGSGRE